MNKTGTQTIETERVIGNISVVKLNENIDGADMGYCMSREYVMRFGTP